MTWRLYLLLLWVFAALVLAGALRLNAEDNKQSAAPQVPDAILAHFWQAQAEVLAAQANLKIAEEEMRSVGDSVKTLCGALYHPELQQKKLYCIANPAPAEKKP